MRTLKADEIECKVKTINKNGCQLLLYKTSRVDMSILDEEFGPGNWQCDYKVVNDNLYCGIGIYINNQWIWKWDCGIESREDGEGNEKKGEASDAFKRAGFKWGIGRELYTPPFIWCKIETIETNGKFKLKDPFLKFKVKSIDYDINNNINKLIIIDNNNKVVFDFKEIEKEPQLITQEQIKQIEDLEIDKIKLCQWAGVDNINKMTYYKAKQAIDKKNTKKLLND